MLLVLGFRISRVSVSVRVIVCVVDRFIVRVSVFVRVVIFVRVSIRVIVSVSVIL